MDRIVKKDRLTAQGANAHVVPALTIQLLGCPHIYSTYILPDTTQNTSIT